MKAYPMRARIRNDGTGPARVDIYDDIGAGGWFSEGYTPASFADAVKGMSGPLDIHINSAGGDVSDGIAIASAIRNYPGKKRTVVDGLAASIASVIAQAGDERIVEPGAMLMIHDPFTAMTGNADEMRKTADTLDKHGDNLAQQYASRAGGTPGQWRDVMKAERWYTADDAVAAGLADKVGSGSAALPQGVDLESLAAGAPGRIMAALRSLPRAAAPPEPYTGPDPCPTCKGKKVIRGGHVTCPDCEGTGKAPEDGAQGSAGGPRAGMAPGKCGTCKGRGKLKHPVRGGEGPMCPSCEGSGTFPPGAAAGAPGGDGEGMELGPQGRLRAKAARPYEPQPYKRSPDENVQCPKCELYSDDDARFCGQCGTQLVGRTDVKEAAMPPAALRRAGVTRDAIPDSVKSTFQSQVKEDSTSDVASAVRRLSQWAGSGSYPEGTTYDDLKWFYDQCAAELQSRDPDSEAGGNFPPEPKGSARRPDGAAIRDCRALTNALAAIAKAAGGGKKDSTDTGISGSPLEQYRAALKGAQ